MSRIIVVSYRNVKYKGLDKFKFRWIQQNIDPTYIIITWNDLNNDLLYYLSDER